MAWREALKKPVAKPTAPKPKFDTKDDDWETDINYENQTNEKSQRYGSSSVPGSGRVDHVDFKNLQEKAKTADSTTREVYQNKNPNRGYGGKYGKDQVMDKSAADYSYRGEVPKHSSQTDCNKGFGGAFGVDDRAKDKSAVGFDYRGEVEKHPSQTDFSKGFGGKYGTDPNAQDKSAVGFSHREAVPKHSSQTDSSKGFGGKYGIDPNAQDKSAVGFSHRETVPKHSSQTDFSKGFGGKYGVQQEEPSRSSTSTRSPEPSSSEKTPPPVGSSIGVGNIRARFENMKKEQEATKRVAEERNTRTTHDQQSQQKQPSTSNGHEKVKQPEIPPTYNQPVREPSPTPVRQPEIQLPSVTNSIIYENLDSRFETQRSEEKQVESNKFIGGVNVASLLRARKASSSSSKHDDDDDEWADNHQHQSYRSPSPIPAAQPEPPSNNEGIRCVARYSYEKTEEDELGFEENEIITNVQKMHDEWWYGKIGSRSGLFPANYAEELN
ncbi:unnamed protein product [Rotaria socialis]|uniref:SH3 domain-containing protein n=1 Tax=Rotaria socialis TaxID=392032 RepID=A0A818WIM2_9BILA|nr:unnamed protein product [Rotaria socialis]CAF3345368.1 unnamed protein product [Rotaria socialis]CAF3481774.1 unnamed protein product [Rotaria socialis]CAF3725415.1 unnamed protein product [Rotaria socialis]